MPEELEGSPYEAIAISLRTEDIIERVQKYWRKYASMLRELAPLKKENAYIGDTQLTIDEDSILIHMVTREEVRFVFKEGELTGRKSPLLGFALRQKRVNPEAVARAFKEAAFLRQEEIPWQLQVTT